MEVLTPFCSVGKLSGRPSTLKNYNPIFSLFCTAGRELGASTKEIISAHCIPTQLYGVHKKNRFPSFSPIFSLFRVGTFLPTIVDYQHQVGTDLPNIKKHSLNSQENQPNFECVYEFFFFFCCRQIYFYNLHFFFYYITLHFTFSYLMLPTRNVEYFFVVHSN